MDVEQLMSAAKGALATGTVFAEPYDKDGLTIIPAARVAGGAGGGSGQQENQPQGEGGGFGISARPAGAFVIRDGRVRWMPAVDANRVILAVAAVAVAAVLSRAVSGRRRPS